MPDPLRPGDPESLGPYRLIGFLGEGGQGAVYLGEATDGRHVAVKVLHARFASDDKALRRFLREVDAARQVAQFCTARVLDAAVSGHSPYVVSEYIEGESLKQLSGRALGTAVRSSDWRSGRPRRCQRFIRPESCTAISSPAMS